MYVSFLHSRFRLHILAIPTLLLLFWVEGTVPALLLLSAAFLHECGHFLCLRLQSIPVTRFDIEPMGATILYRATDIPPDKSAWVAFAGAASNLCVALLASPFLLCAGETHFPYLFFFVLCNLFFAFLNLLPLEHLDGGKLLFEFLLWKKDPDTAERICKTVSKLFMLLLTLFIVIFGLHSDFPLWTLLLSAVFLSRL